MVGCYTIKRGCSQIGRANDQRTILYLEAQRRYVQCEADVWIRCHLKAIVEPAAFSGRRDSFVVPRRHYFPFPTKWIDESLAAGPLYGLSSLSILQINVLSPAWRLECAHTTRESTGIRIHVPRAYWHLIHFAIIRPTLSTGSSVAQRTRFVLTKPRVRTSPSARRERCRRTSRLWDW